MRRAKVWVARIKHWGRESRFLQGALSFALHGYLIVVGVIGIFGLFSSITGVRIHTFFVEGNSAVPGEKIISATEDILSRPLAFIIGRDVPLWAPHQEIAAAVYALDPHIHDVTVDGRFSRTLSVKITEETPALLWCGADVPTATGTHSGECWFANDKGTIYAEARGYTDVPYQKFYTTPTPIFFDPYPRTHEYPLGYVIADEITMKRLRSMSDALSERGYRVVSIGVTSDADVALSTHEGTHFLLSLSRNIVEDMKRFEALREALEVKKSEGVLKEVDLRFENKIYYQ